jgi:hypothetical protein
MDTYSHLVPGMADDAAERFGGYLFGSDWAAGRRRRRPSTSW